MALTASRPALPVMQPEVLEYAAWLGIDPVTDAGGSA